VTPRDEMLSLRSKLLAEHPQLTTAGELAPLMGEFEREYWEWTLDRMAAELEATWFAAGVTREETK